MRTEHGRGTGLRGLRGGLATLGAALALVVAPTLAPMVTGPGAAGQAHAAPPPPRPAKPKKPKPEAKPEVEVKPEAEPTLQRSNRMELDARLVRGETARSGAVYLFQRAPRRLPPLVALRQSYLGEIVTPVLGPTPDEPAPAPTPAPSATPAATPGPKDGGR